MVHVRQSDGRNARHATICSRTVRHAAQMRAGEKMESMALDAVGRSISHLKRGSA